MSYSVPPQTAAVQHEVPFLTFLPSRSAEVSNSGRLLMTLILSSRWLTLKIFERQNVTVFTLIHCFGPGKNNYWAKGIHSSTVECLPDVLEAWTNLQHHRKLKNNASQRYLPSLLSSDQMALRCHFICCGNISLGTSYRPRKRA